MVIFNLKELNLLEEENILISEWRMASKVLKQMEVLRGFIQIPAESKVESESRLFVIQVMLPKKLLLASQNAL